MNQLISAIRIATNRLFLLFVFTAIGWTSGPSLAAAKVTRLEISSKTAYGSFVPGDYVRWEGRIVGELSPTSEIIPDLDKAARNPNGMVVYSSRVTLLMPAEPAKGNGALLLDIPNRGRPISHSLYNSPRDLPIALGPLLDEGTGFLEDQGYTIVSVAWELGQGADLPTFDNGDGKTHYVEGVGFAIVRDTADFLATASVDSTGQANPVAGIISRTLAVGYSQTGRFLKSALLHGFNMVDNRRVFAGMHILGGAAGQLPILRSGTGPDPIGIPTFADPEFRGVNEEPLAIAEIIARARAKRDPATDRDCKHDNGLLQPPCLAGAYWKRRHSGSSHPCERPNL
jgi:hypothetical protein